MDVAMKKFWILTHGFFTEELNAHPGSKKNPTCIMSTACVKICHNYQINSWVTDLEIKINKKGHNELDLWPLEAKF